MAGGGWSRRSCWNRGFFNSAHRSRSDIFLTPEDFMKQISWVGALAIALLGAAAPALAHHSLQSEYDINQSITLKGTVTKVDWVNPHVYVYLDVKDDKGAVTKWAVTTLPPGNLRSEEHTSELQSRLHPGC